MPLKTLGIPRHRAHAAVRLREEKEAELPVFFCLLITPLLITLQSGALAATSPARLGPVVSLSRRASGVSVIDRAKQFSLSSMVGWNVPVTLGEHDAYIDLEPDLQIDSKGIPWMIWLRTPRGSSASQVIYWSHRPGEVWAPPQRATPNDDSGVFKPRFEFDAADTAWLVWNSQNGNDILFTRGYEGNWGQPAPVDPAKGSLDYYSPEIAIGGGQIWVTWLGGIGTDSLNVYVSHWTGASWASPTEITAGIPGYHWFADIAVDINGTPHVVWEELTEHLLYHREYDNGIWSIPLAINDSSDVAAADWAAPQIVAEGNGQLSMVWVGRKSGNGLQQIFYSSFRNLVWSAPVQISQHNAGNAFYPVIALHDLSNIWIAWDHDEATGSISSTTWSAQFNEQNGATQTRLDTGVYFYNQLPRLALDQNGCPAAAWEAFTQDNSDDAIFFANYVADTPVLFSDFGYFIDSHGIRLHWQADSATFRSFDVQKSSDKGLSYISLSRVQATVLGTYEWLDTSAFAGTYLYRILGNTNGGSSLLLGTITVSIKQKIAMKVENPVRGDRVHVQVEVTGFTKLIFHISDVAGRTLPWRQTEWIPPGTHNLILRWSELGKFGHGVYFLVAESDSQVNFRVPLVLVP